MRFYGAVHDGDGFAIFDDVENADFQRRRIRHRGIAGLEIDLHAEPLGEGRSAERQVPRWDSRAGEMDTAAEADPIEAFKQQAKLASNRSSNAEKASSESFSQLQCSMKPETRSMTASTRARSHSPRRLKERAGSARSKWEWLIPDLPAGLWGRCSFGGEPLEAGRPV